MTLYLDRGPGTIAYDDTGGGGRLVVAVPGMGDVRALYRFTVPALAAAGHRVVTMDLRGHGESSVGWPDHSAQAIAGDVVALVRHLDAGPAVVLGESVGAAVAVWAATEAPQEIAGIVLLGPSLGAARLTPVMRVAAWLAGRSAAVWSAYYRSLYPTRPPEDLPAYLRALRANLRERGRLAALRATLRTALAGESDPGDRIDAVGVPALVVMGTRDADVPDPAGEAARIGRRLAARVVMVEGAGHYPQTELPEVTNPELVRFLAELPDRVA